MLTLNVKNFNEILRLYLSDPVGQKHLKDDWRTVIRSNFELDDIGLRDFMNLSQDRVTKVQQAINLVIRKGGEFRMQAANSDEESKLAIRPTLSPDTEQICCQWREHNWCCHIF